MIPRKGRWSDSLASRATGAIIEPVPGCAWRIGVMCQLLGMNCNVPTDIVFSLTGFQQRGGGTDEHADGWGIAFFEGKGYRAFLDPEPAAHSALADFVRQLSDPLAQRHRPHPQGNARSGRSREHASVRARAVGPLLDLRPQRDAGRLRAASRRTLSGGGQHRQRGGVLRVAEHPVPALPERGARRRMRSGRKSQRGRARLSALGAFNFLLSDGERLFAHCSTQLAYIERRAPFTKARLIDADLEVDFSQVTTPQRSRRRHRHRPAHRQ